MPTIARQENFVMLLMATFNLWRNKFLPGWDVMYYSKVFGKVIKQQPLLCLLSTLSFAANCNRKPRSYVFSEPELINPRKLPYFMKTVFSKSIRDKVSLRNWEQIPLFRQVTWLTYWEDEMSRLQLRPSSLVLARAQCGKQRLLGMAASVAALRKVRRIITPV